MESESPVKEGDVLAGKYRIERVLGVGGMGVVVAATHLQLDQRVALKFLLQEALEIPEVVQRFAREARAAAKIQSEHVARVIDVGTLDSGSPYMVMEYLQGQDLRAVLDDTGALTIEQAAGYVLQACEAIAEAHAVGIVHRDLKPANMFLATRADRPSIVKVLDFGISKTREADAAITKTSAMMGSPMYMSPEQMKATKNVDVRTDIWALGIILYELVTNDRPFGGETVPEVIANVLSEPLRPLRELLPNVPADFEKLVHRCLEKKANDRYANVAELVEALAKFAPASQRHSVERVFRVLGARPSQQPSEAPSPAEPKQAERSAIAVAKTQVAEPAAPAAATGAAWTNTSSGAKSATWKRPAIAIGAVFVIALGAGIGVVLATRNAEPAAAGVTPPPSSPALVATTKEEPVTAPKATTRAGAEPTAAPPATTAPSAPVSASAASTPPPKPTHAVPVPVTGLTARTPPTVTPPAVTTTPKTPPPKPTETGLPTIQIQ